MSQRPSTAREKSKAKVEKPSPDNDNMSRNTDGNPDYGIGSGNEPELGPGGPPSAEEVSTERLVAHEGDEDADRGGNTAFVHPARRTNQPGDISELAIAAVLPPELRRIFECIVQTYDAMPEPPTTSVTIQLDSGATVYLIQEPFESRTVESWTI